MKSWTYRFPPLAAIAVAFLLAIVILPSALNVPQTNPATTLSYAPVPPEDSDVPPPGGNVSSLGLGSSGLLAQALEKEAGPPPPEVRGKTPVGKRCVGKPPRQTEDPLSPPCVAYFNGNNGGATYKGVTKGEIRVVFYIQGGISWISSRGLDSAPAGKYFDIDEPGGENLIWVRGIRAFQRFFNNRFQTYGRRVHFWVHFSSFGPGGTTPENRRADAADEEAKIDPFAVIIDAEGRLEEPYMEEHAQNDTLVFSSRYFRPAAFFRSFAGQFWGYLPSREQQAEQYASFVCQMVLPFPVSGGDNPGQQGTPRRLGFIRTTDPEYPSLIKFSLLAKEKIEACGGKFIAEATFPEHFSIYNQDRNPPSYAVQNMADFQQKGVTTVIWPGGFESNQSRAAASLTYRPEWILAGDGTSDGATANAHQEKSVWRHAWVITSTTMEPEVTATECYRSLKEADPDIPHEDAREMCSFSDFYEAIRQLYTGIQVAGPRLSTSSINQGFHAIPEVRSTDPSLPACYFNPGDYTCVKDAVLMRWDPAGSSGVSTAPDGTGCWRGASGGIRFHAGEWPDKDFASLERPDDPCNSYGGQVSLR